MPPKNSEIAAIWQEPYATTCHRHAKLFPFLWTAKQFGRTMIQEHAPKPDTENQEPESPCLFKNVKIIFEFPFYNAVLIRTN